MKKYTIALILGITTVTNILGNVTLAQEKPQLNPVSILAGTSENQDTEKSSTILSMVFEEMGELQEMESELSKLKVNLQYERNNGTQAEITRDTKETERAELLEEINTIREEIDELQKEIYVLKTPQLEESNEGLTEEEIQKRAEEKAAQEEKLSQEKELLLTKEQSLKEEEKTLKEQIQSYENDIEKLSQEIPKQKEQKNETIADLETQIQSQEQAIQKQRQLIRQQIADLVSSIVILVVLVLSIFILRWIAFRLIQRLHMPLSRKAALSHIVRVTFNVIIALIVTGIIFSQFTNVVPFILLLGTGLAFAVRDSISSFIGWFIIGSESGFHINDIISLGDAHGKVKEISLLTSMIIEMDEHGETGKIISIPNKFIFDNPLVNFSRSYGLSRITLNIDMQWGDDLEEAELELMKALSETIDSLLEQAEFSPQSYSHKLDRGKLHPQVAIHDKDTNIELSLVCFVPIELKYLAKQEIIRRYNKWILTKNKKEA